MKRIFIILIVFSLPLLVKAQADPLQRVEVSGKMEKLKKALIDKDSSGLSMLLADEVTYGHTNGVIQTKAQLIHSVMSGEQDYESIDFSDSEWRFYNNTVVVTMKSRVKLIYNNQQLDLNMFVLLVWVKKDWKGKNSDWELVARQSVKI